MCRGPLPKFRRVVMALVLVLAASASCGDIWTVDRPQQCRICTMQITVAPTAASGLLVNAGGSTSGAR